MSEIELSKVVRESHLTYKAKSKIESPVIVSSGLSEGFMRKVFPKDQIDVKEFFYVLALDRANKVIGYTQLSSGGATSTVVDVAMLAQWVLLQGARGVIVGHNHPSGQRLPSVGDSRLTKQIKDALKLFNITLLDHIILMPEEGYFSFADEGLI